MNKIEELENENHQLNNRIKEMIKDRDNVKATLNEITQDLKKKDEEMRNFHGMKAEIAEQTENQEELAKELKLRDFKINELKRVLDEQKRSYDIEIGKLKV